jgi:hypothetical protein
MIMDGPSLGQFAYASFVVPDGPEVLALRRHIVDQCAIGKIDPLKRINPT